MGCPWLPAWPCAFKAPCMEVSVGSWAMLGSLLDLSWLDRPHKVFGEARFQACSCSEEHSIWEALRPGRRELPFMPFDVQCASHDSDASACCAAQFPGQ